MWLCYLLFLSVSYYWLPAESYADGKVTKACGSMKPHHDSHSRTSNSPYHLATNTTRFSPGDRVQVILSGSNFEGFLLEARDAVIHSLVSAVGSFTLTDPTKTQLLTCNNVKDSAVSHTSSVVQTEVVVFWNAPKDAPKVVQFFVTVVAHYSVFWVKQPGPVIYQDGVTPLPPQSTTMPTTMQTTTPSVLPGPFSSEGCGHSKSCLLDPPGCDPEKDPKCFFLSMTTEGPEKTLVLFELSGPAEGYVTFALSWDTMMGDDDVYMCVMDEDRISVSAAYVTGRTHPEDQSQSGLSSVSWRIAEGVIQCRFSRPVRMTNQRPHRYDLDQEYFLFLASGNAQYGKIWKHTLQPLISTSRKQITGAPEVLRGSRGPLLMKLHGALMLIAWMLTGSIGTFIGSYYKSEWLNKTLLSQKVWFQVHRGLMVLTVGLTVIAFCLPFVYRKGWSKHAGIHPYLGCCVLALALIQSVMAAFRPPPDSHRRYIFNWAHWGVGSVVEIMAVVSMFLGMRQSSLLLPLPKAMFVLIGYVGGLALFRLILSLHKFSRYIKRPAASSDQETLLSDQSNLGHWESLMKSIILAVLILENTGLLVVLLTSIVEL
ncbi:putative ferric-chelate reductase 1 [Lampris incognitus]|uniref:putative ferric-chelate reductase 1 n=1 Tax=Lampris incognitus TaxID=2546036 RepID=UPI0024B585CC|nr:putative ferric-chelate reductase 1 [Lampris incognitus]